MLTYPSVFPVLIRLQLPLAPRSWTRVPLVTEPAIAWLVEGPLLTFKASAVTYMKPDAGVEGAAWAGGAAGAIAAAAWTGAAPTGGTWGGLCDHVALWSWRLPCLV